MANPVPVIDPAVGDGNDNNKTPNISAKKQRRSANILRVAVYRLRRKSSSSSANPKKTSEGGGGGLPAQVAAGGRKDGFWKNLMTAVRPISIEDQLRPTTPRSTVVTALVPPPQMDPAMFHDLMSDQSPFHDSSSSCASSSVDPMSRYASAQDLKQLDDATGDDDEQGDRHVVPGEGNQAIDLLAEEFIAKFYEQIRLQKLESVNDRSNRVEIVEEISTSTTAAT